MARAAKPVTDASDDLKFSDLPAVITMLVVMFSLGSFAFDFGYFLTVHAHFMGAFPITDLLVLGGPLGGFFFVITIVLTVAISRDHVRVMRSATPSGKTLPVFLTIFLLVYSLFVIASLLVAPANWMRPTYIMRFTTLLATAGLYATVLRKDSLFPTSYRDRVAVMGMLALIINTVLLGSVMGELNENSARAGRTSCAVLEKGDGCLPIVFLGTENAIVSYKQMVILIDRKQIRFIQASMDK